MSEPAAWHSYHGTNSEAPRKLRENCRVARQETGRDWGNADPAARVPVLVPSSRPRRPKSQHAIRDTDGSLLGGCGWNRDLRAKVLVFAAAHIHIHTTAQQPTFCSHCKNATLWMTKSQVKRTHNLNFPVLHEGIHTHWIQLRNLSRINDNNKLGHLNHQ